MATIDLTSKYLRNFAVTTDKFGIDPLLDKVVPRLRLIQTYKVHIVSQDERGAPDLIAFREYGTEDLWWVVLGYNGIGSYSDIIEGTNLKIASLTSVISLITENSIRPNKTQRVITI